MKELYQKHYDSLNDEQKGVFLVILKEMTLNNKDMTLWDETIEFIKENEKQLIKK